MKKLLSLFTAVFFFFSSVAPIWANTLELGSSFTTVGEVQELPDGSTLQVVDLEEEILVDEISVPKRVGLRCVGDNCFLESSTSDEFKTQWVRVAVIVVGTVLIITFVIVPAISGGGSSGGPAAITGGGGSSGPTIPGGPL